MQPEESANNNPLNPIGKGRNKGQLDPIDPSKAEKIFKLKKKGHSYGEIAKELGISTFTAHGYVTKAAREYTKSVTKAQGRALVMAQARLDDFLKAIYDDCLQGDLKDRLKAIDTALKIVAAQTKLSGLDQPSVTQALSITANMGDAEVHNTLRTLAPLLNRKVIDHGNDQD